MIRPWKGLALGMLVLGCGRSPWDIGLVDSDGEDTEALPAPMTTATTGTTPVTTGSTAVCGDGVRDEGEACDDGNQANGDGCADDCTIEDLALWTDNTFHGLGHGVALDPEGNIVVVGVDYESIAAEGTNAWIRKYSPEGEVLWTVSHDEDEGSEEAFDVAVGTGGHIFVAGKVGDDIWVGEFEANGSLLREFTRGGSGRVDVGRGVTLLPSGELAAVGTLQVSDDPDDTDIWVGVWGVFGMVVWQRTFAGTGGSADEAWAVVNDDQGRIFLTGTLTNGAGNRDVVVVGLGPDGELLWDDQHTGPGDGRDEGLGVTLGPSGDVVVTGYLQNETGYVAWLRSYDPDGEPRWTTVHDHRGDGTDAASAAAVTPAGDLAVVGQVDPDQSRIWLGGFSAQGDHQWSIIDALHGTGHDVAFLPSGRAVVVGSTYEDTQRIWVSVFEL